MERRSLKKIRASTGFEPVTSALPWSFFTFSQLLLGKLINKDESREIKGARKVGGAKNQSRERCVTMTALCCVLSFSSILAVLASITKHFKEWVRASLWHHQRKSFFTWTTQSTLEVQAGIRVGIMPDTCIVSSCNNMANLQREIKLQKILFLGDDLLIVSRVEGLGSSKTLSSFSLTPTLKSCQIHVIHKCVCAYFMYMYNNIVTGQK